MWCFSHFIFAWPYISLLAWCDDVLAISWSHDQLPKWQRTKVVALYCSFQNQLELCSKVLPLLRYELEDFQKCHVFFCFFVFFSMKTTPNNMISPHLESQRKRLQLLYCGKFTKKGRCIPPKGNWHCQTTRFTNRLQKSDMDYKVY